MARDFVLTFDGPALQTGRMPVRDLAPALLALGELFQEANVIVDPVAAPVTLEVRAVERGSFGVDLHVAREIASLLSQPGVQQAALLVGFITDASQGFLAFIRWLRNRQIAQRTDAGNGNIEIHDNHGSIFVMPNAVGDIYNSPRARSLAREVVRPLKEPGIEELRIERTGVAEVLRVREDETEGFDAPIPEETLTEQELTMYVQIVSPVFTRGNKWKFTAGAIPSFWAAIEDDLFWDRVEAGRDLFGYGDLLHARMRMRQSRGMKGELDTEWSVVQVLNHVRGSNPTPSLWSDSQDEPPTSSE